MPRLRRVGLLAGEPSGDLLGASLMDALTRRHPGVRFEGVGGPAMTARGLDSLLPMETLSVMGLTEVLAHLPALLRARRRIGRHFLDHPPDCFLGIDSPDFNLGLERRLRRHGIPTAHYVSPSVWAWRPGRIKGIARSVDLMLTLFPFEADFYQEHGVPVQCVGHPAADDYPLQPDRAAARVRLGLPTQAQVVALLPGSRRGEVGRLGAAFAGAAALLASRHPRLRLVAPMATPATRALFGEALDQAGGAAAVRLLDGDSRLAMEAADVVLTASGTATLEAMLLKRPMVVAYAVSPATAWLVRRLRLLRVGRFALPNLLAGELVVPEYIQEAVTAQALAGAVSDWLDEPSRRDAVARRFEALHRELRRNAGESAALALERLAGAGP